MAGALNHLLRKRDGGHARVGFAELFYDLVFVFAITQLSHSLIAHMTPLGFAETGLLFLATWWTWIYTAWATNWLDPEKAGVRLMLFVLMGAGLLFSLSIPQAFGDRGALFAAAFVFMQVGRSLFLTLVMRRSRAGPMNFVRITSWMCLSGAFWLWGGFSDPHDRLLLWGIAVGIEFVGPFLGYRVPGLGASDPDEWDVEGAHMAERCGLFIIIALGESILITGTTFGGTPWTPGVIAGFASAFVGTIAMWWVYFNIGADRASTRIAHEAHAGRKARTEYTFLHIPIVAGIVVTAASDEMVLKHPGGHAEPLVAACLVGGPALYLLGNLFFKRATAGFFQLSHLVGLALLGTLGVAAVVATPLMLSIGASAVLVLVGLWETRSLGSRKADLQATAEISDSTH